MTRMWCCSVITEKIDGDWTAHVHSPTFFLFGDAQGITSDEGAERVARRMFEDAGARVISVAVTETSMVAHGATA